MSTENNPFAVRLRALTLLGEGYLALGWLTEALQVFAEAGTQPAKDKLIVCGDTALRKGGRSEIAVRAYAMAGATDKIRACAEEFEKDNLVTLALEAYVALGDKERLIAFADRCREQYPQFACTAYRTADAQREKLILCGERALVLGGTYDAIIAFTAARAPEKLIEAGNHLLSERRLDDARSIYTAAARVELGILPT